MSKAENFDITWLLLENGGEGSKEIKNGAGKLPLDIAREHNLEEIIQELEKTD